jgi:transposase
MNKRIKYSYEQKLKAVLLVLKEHRSKQSAATEIGCDRKTVNLWVNQYKHLGIKGLINQHNNYSEEFKLTVARHMDEKHLSLLKTAIKFGLSDPSTVFKWKRKYDQGELPLMKEKAKDLKKEKEERELKEKTKEELIKEIKYLKAENAYLKKVRDLVLEKEALEKGKRQKPSKN